MALVSSGDDVDGAGIATEQGGPERRQLGISTLHHCGRFFLKRAKHRRTKATNRAKTEIAGAGAAGLAVGTAPAVAGRVD
jgi:hypothetical protein